MTEAELLSLIAELKIIKCQLNEALDSVNQRIKELTRHWKKVYGK